jgi:hypothetical protein
MGDEMAALWPSIRIISNVHVSVMPVKDASRSETCVETANYATFVDDRQAYDNLYIYSICMVHGLRENL